MLMKEKSKLNCVCKFPITQILKINTNQWHFGNELTLNKRDNAPNTKWDINIDYKSKYKCAFSRIHLSWNKLNYIFTQNGYMLSTNCFHSGTMSRENLIWGHLSSKINTNTPV